MKKIFTLFTFIALFAAFAPQHAWADKGDQVALWFPKGDNAADDKAQGQADFSNCVTVCHTFGGAYNLWSYNTSTSKRALKFDTGGSLEKGETADDWCFLPAVALKGGVAYVCDYCVINNSLNQLDTKHEFYLATSTDPAGEMVKLHTQVVEKTEVNSFTDEAATPQKQFAFDVAADGTYYLAIHIVTEYTDGISFSGNMFNNIKLTDNGVATGIQAIATDAAPAALYSLDGKRLQQAPTRGFCIRDGRKEMKF